MMTSRQSMHQVHPIDPKALRRVCGLFPTGVAVITTEAGGHATGTTVNSFTSVSLDPPMVLFCLHTQSRLLPVLAKSGSFTVNLLRGEQELLARSFAGKHTATVHDQRHHHSAEGVPILSDALAYLSCRIVEQFTGGDHAIVLGEVVELGIPERGKEPLVFFDGSFGALDGEHRAFHPIWDG